LVFFIYSFFFRLLYFFIYFDQGVDFPFLSLSTKISGRSCFVDDSEDDFEQPSTFLRRLKP